MKKMFMLLAIACALLMSVPVLANQSLMDTSNSACTNDTPADVNSAATNQAQPAAAETSRCTSAVSRPSADLNYIASSSAALGPAQRLEVAASTRTVTG